MSDDGWQAARLIPVSGLGGQEEKERRAASALLAVLGAVKEFGREILKPLGAPAGTIATFCEVPFELERGRTVRVDGLVQVTRGKRTWTLVVEVKTGSAEVSREQVESYMDVARVNGFDGLLTVTNQIAFATGRHPVEVDGRKLRRTPLHHLSWARILSLAQLVKDHRGVSDPDQAWILGELIRYLEYPGSGAMSFDDMGSRWAAIRTAAKAETLRASDPGVDETAARWDQLIQYLCLRLGSRLGEDVRPVLSRKEVAEPQTRLLALAKELAGQGTLSGGIRIPNAVGPIRVKANLRRMMAQASVSVDAPLLKRHSARLNWLLRQLDDAPPQLRVDVSLEHTRRTESELLGNLRDDGRAVLPGGTHSPRSFELTLSHDVGGNRKAGRKGFITDVERLVDSFYRDVVQDLKAWSPPAPQLPEAKDGDPGSEAVIAE